MGDLTNDFSRSEFDCPCCGADGVDLEIVDVLQTIRDAVGHRIAVSSGVRCEEHNEEVGGVSTSEHIYGNAVDVVCQTSALRFIIIREALRAGITRIGVSSDFVHLGTSVRHTPNVCWTY